MAKATLTLPNGTTVNIEGTAEEVRNLLNLYNGGTLSVAAGPSKPLRKAQRRKSDASISSTATSGAAESTTVTDIVAHVKNSDEAEAIERHVLDRASQVDRTLLPLYIVHEHLGNAFGLSSGEVSRVTTELGVPISVANASRTLSGIASKYVIGDRVRRKGQLVKYKLSRRGIQYMRSVIRGTASDDKK